MRAGLDSNMHSMVEEPGAVNTDSAMRLKRPIHPGCMVLRQAVRQNIVSFPSQIPVFYLKGSPADMQWRVVSLFFVRAWSTVDIAVRFGVPRHRIRKMLYDWCVRALALGYVEVMDPDAFAACCRPEFDGAGWGADRPATDLAQNHVQHRSNWSRKERASYAVA